ncbi:hypothetical protein B0H10DRAFT_1698976, partial [Mycena sp. CBHHK59/15]
PGPGECTGSIFFWDLDDILGSYPLSIHTWKSRRDPGYSLLSIDVVKSVLHVRSTNCRRLASGQGGSCKPCSNLEPCIHVVRDWARQSYGKKPTARLSHNQLEQKLVSVGKQLKNEQLKVCLVARSLNRGCRWSLISTNDVPGLPRLLSNARKDGWGISKTYKKISLAIAGQYHACNYTDLDTDLAILTYEL